MSSDVDALQQVAPRHRSLYLPLYRTAALAAMHACRGEEGGRGQDQADPH